MHRRSAPPALRALVPGLAVAALLTGCSSEDEPTPAAAAPPSPTASATPSCPTAPGGTDAFPPGLPADFPADFPAPTGAAQAVPDDGDATLVEVHFPSAQTLSDAVRFATRELPAAGFAITGGDSEPHEADIVFAKDERSGLLRIARVDDCTTFWTVRVERS